MSVVDAHHHFWDTTTGEFTYDWMTDDLTAIRGRFGPAELQPALAERGVEHTVLVQTLPSLPETEGYLAIAAATGFVAGVVGWVDLTDPGVAETIARLRDRPDGRGLVGIRHQAQDEPDPDWLALPEVLRGVAAVARAGLAYDVLIHSRELPAALALVRSRPECRFVVDHIAKPNIREHEIEPWASGMRALAVLPNVWVKVSGMIEEAGWTTWRPDDIRPYVEMVLDWFGPDRLIFGSNWPVCLVAGSYGQVVDALSLALVGIGEDDRSRIFGGNAIAAYRLAL